MNENAKKDLKEGLLLYNSENNVGLKNAWNIIQAEVRAGGRDRCGWKAGPGPQTPRPSLGWATSFLGQTWCSGRQLQWGGGVGGQQVLLLEKRTMETGKENNKCPLKRWGHFHLKMGQPDNELGSTVDPSEGIFSLVSLSENFSICLMV